MPARVALRDRKARSALSRASNFSAEDEGEGNAAILYLVVREGERGIGLALGERSATSWNKGF
jgi:hypothetical protein